MYLSEVDRGYIIKGLKSLKNADLFSICVFCFITTILFIAGKQGEVVALIFSLVMIIVLVLTIKEYVFVKSALKRFDSGEYVLFVDTVAKKVKKSNNKRRMYIRTEEKQVHFAQFIWYCTEEGSKVKCIRFDELVYIYGVV